MDADRNIALLASLVEAMNLVLVAWAREEAARYGMTLETMAELQRIDQEEQEWLERRAAGLEEVYREQRESRKFSRGEGT